MTPRATRLVRVAELHAFREAVVTLACDGVPLDARDRLVLLPARAAAAQLVRSIERRMPARSGAAIPDLITPRELVGHLGERLQLDRPMLTDSAREVLLGLACRTAREAGCDPPFRLRPALVSEMLRLYDTLRRNQKEVDTFERLALGRLEPGADVDRGAERLVRQTRFLVAAFRDFEQRCVTLGLDEHQVRERLIAERCARPFRHAVVTVSDDAFDPHGLPAADWDLLARIPGLERLDVVVTDSTLAGAAHERMHALLPGIEEVRFEASGGRVPVLMTPGHGATAHIARDREEEVAAFVRRAKRAVRSGDEDLERMALVVQQPLPYVYVAREIFRSAGVPCQMFDALPLAAEPYAAALDLVLGAVTSSFGRIVSIALLRSPHFRFGTRDVEPDRLSSDDIAALDRALSESGYRGELSALETLLQAWGAAEAPRSHRRRALVAGAVLLAVARELEPLRSPAPAGEHLSTLVAFLERHESLPGPDDPLWRPERRARTTILGTLGALREAYARFDPAPIGFDEVAALVRRWIEGQTFAPRAGDMGVHLVDAESARFGDFDAVQLAGLVDGEWPEPARRNIFYSPGILKDLGWPSEADRRETARGRFADLLRLPAKRLIVSTFSLENDAVVAPSVLLDGLEPASLEAVAESPATSRIFEYEALGTEPVHVDALAPFAREWAAHRLTARERSDARRRGFTDAHTAAVHSVSALERYQDCPFQFFAADVLRLEEDPEDESVVSPRARGRLIHEVFQRFFESWDARGGGPITPARIDSARMLCAEVAEPLLARLPHADAALERSRLFGSAIAVGAVEVVLGLEASRPADVQERWLEYRLEGEFSLLDDRSRVPLRGVADRIDLLAGRRLRVIDYKSGAAPDVKRALQAAVYALCAKERLESRDGQPWVVDEAAYVALTGRRALVPVVKSGDAQGHETLEAARTRLTRTLDGIHRGEFPPRPHDPMMCRSCSFSTVCRKDYVGDG